MLLAEQLIGIGVMALLGLAGGLLYDSFRAFRQVLGWKKWGTLFSDVLYSLILVCAFVLALLAVNDGQLRSYVYLGLMLGYVVYFGMLHRFFWRPLLALLSGLIWVSMHLFRLLTWPFRFMYKALSWPWRILRQKWALKRQQAAQDLEEDLE